MKIRNPSLLTAGAATIFLCLIAQDFVESGARVAFVCLAVLAAGMVGLVLGRSQLSGVTLPGIRPTQSSSSGSFQPGQPCFGAAVADDTQILENRAEMVEALVLWGREEIHALGLGRRLTSLDVFSADGAYSPAAEKLTLDRALKIFDEYMEDGSDLAAAVTAAASRFTGSSNPTATDSDYALDFLGIADEERTTTEVVDGRLTGTPLRRESTLDATA